MVALGLHGTPGRCAVCTVQKAPADQPSSRLGMGRSGCVGAQGPSSPGRIEDIPVPLAGRNPKAATAGPAFLQSQPFWGQGMRWRKQGRCREADLNLNLDVSALGCGTGLGAVFFSISVSWSSKRKRRERRRFSGFQG